MPGDYDIEYASPWAGATICREYPRIYLMPERGIDQRPAGLRKAQRTPGGT